MIGLPPGVLPERIERLRYAHLRVVAAPEHRADPSHATWTCELCSAWRWTIEGWIVDTQNRLDREARVRALKGD
jgi:hypothetical protein